MAAIRLVSIVLLAASMLASARSEDFPNVTSFKQLWVTFSAANEYALKCGGKVGCLGEKVTVTLKVDIPLPQALFPLRSNANYAITGACPNRKGGLCVFDGKDTWKAFQSGITAPGAPGRLELTNLIFQRVKGGVIDDIFFQVVAKDVTFRNNINGVVKNVGFGTGSPPLSFTKCRFLNNNGTAIQSGNPSFNPTVSGGGLTIRRSLFRDNVNGAVVLMRAGKTVFENVKFERNIGISGGAVSADQTDVVFRGTEFTNNKGTAKAGASAVLLKSGKSKSVKAGFCSCKFGGNATPTIVVGTPGGRVDVAFCDTKIPPSSVLPKEPAGSVTVGSGKTCLNSFC